MKTLTLATLACVLAATVASAQQLSISIGIRETGGTGPAFSNAGSTGGIEWVNRDGQTLIANGTWQLFTFRPSTDTLTAFAGTTANGVLDQNWVALESIRILNSGSIGSPIRLWIDEFKNTSSGGSVTEGFESFTAGTEVMFQEPRYSGSTAGNLATLPNASLLTDTVAFGGTISDEINFQFLDNAATRWLRLTTFATANLANPAFLAKETGFVPEFSFYAMAVVVPEPSAAALLGIGLLAFLARLRRR